MTLGLAVAAGSLLAANLPTTAGEPHSASDAYAFGFVSAAATTCEGVTAEFADRLSVSVAHDPEGRVSNDVAQGFSAFALAVDARGAADACVSARRFVSPTR